MPKDSKPAQTKSTSVTITGTKTTSVSKGDSSVTSKKETTYVLKVEDATSEASTSKKRPAGEPASDTDTDEKRPMKVQKTAKIPTMFLSRSAKAAAQANAPFKWLPALAVPAHQSRKLPALTGVAGPSNSTGVVTQVGPATCLHGVHLEPKASTKVAIFDLDDTLVTRKSGKKFSDDPTDWKLWCPNVGEKIKTAAADGFSIVVFTNQAGLPVKDREAKWKKKIPMIAESAFSDVPFRIFAAKEKDGFRKPMLGMWDALAEEYKKEGVVIDKSASYFVGDAAGRLKPKDHSAADRKMAQNIGIQFYTPDEYFKGQKVNLPPLTGFHPSSLQAPSAPPPTLISASSSPEVVLFVGPPGCGKSSVYKKQFAPAGYAHVNQDTLKDKKKCVREVERVLNEGGKCVVDNTNRDKATRAEYIKIAKQLKCPIRCVYFDTTPELAWHNNIYRAFHAWVGDEDESVKVVEDVVETSTVVEEKESDSEDEGEDKPKKKQKKSKKTTTTTTTTTTATTSLTMKTTSPPRKLVPWIAYTTFRSHFEEPQLSEGFDKLDRVGFVFEGSEEDRERWNKWLEL